MIIFLNLYQTKLRFSKQPIDNLVIHVFVPQKTCI